MFNEFYETMVGYFLTTARATIDAWLIISGQTQPEARIIRVIRLQTQTKNGKEAVSLVTFCANARSADRAFAPKRDPRIKRI